MLNWLNSFSVSGFIGSCCICCCIQCCISFRPVPTLQELLFTLMSALFDILVESVVENRFLLQWKELWDQPSEDQCSVFYVSHHEDSDLMQNEWTDLCSGGVVQSIKAQNKHGACEWPFSAVRQLWGREESGYTHLLVYSGQDRWRPFWPNLWGGGVGGAKGSRRQREGWEEQECDKKQATY